MAKESERGEMKVGKASKICDPRGAVDEETKQTAFIDMMELCPLDKSAKTYRQMRSFQCEDITCAYKNKDGSVKDILRGVTMEVERQQMLAIIGESFKLSSCASAPTVTSLMHFFLDRVGLISRNLYLIIQVRAVVARPAFWTSSLRGRP